MCVFRHTFYSSHTPADTCTPTQLIKAWCKPRRKSLDVERKGCFSFSFPTVVIILACFLMDNNNYEAKYGF